MKKNISVGDLKFKKSVGAAQLAAIWITMFKKKG